MGCEINATNLFFFLTGLLLDAFAAYLSHVDSRLGSNYLDLLRRGDLFWNGVPVHFVAGFCHVFSRL